MSRRLSGRTRGALLMILSALGFSMMQIMIAWSADEVPLFEQLFFRNLFATGLSYVAIRRKGLNWMGHRGNRRLLFLRSLLGYLGMVTLFYATAHAAQGDVAVVNKMSPFIVVVFAVLFLKERIRPYQIVTLIMAFGGAIIVADPSFSSDSLPMVVAFLSAVFAGAAYAMVGALKGREAPEVIVFFFSAFSTAVTFFLMVPQFVMPSPTALLMLVGIGAFASVGQIALTYSYAAAPASEVSLYNYSGIVFSMVLGFLLLGQPLRLRSLAGAALVIGAGYVAHRAQRNGIGQNN